MAWDDELQLRQARQLLFAQLSAQINLHYGEPLTLWIPKVDESGHIFKEPGPVSKVIDALYIEVHSDYHLNPLKQDAAKNIPILVQLSLKPFGAPPLDDSQVNSLESWLGMKAKDIVVRY